MKRRLLSVIAALVAAAAVCTFGGCSSSEEKAVGNVKDVTLQEDDVFAVINVMDYGSITVKLFPDVAPKAVQRFITLATRGYYDGKSIHRVIPDMLIQGGSFTGTGYDGNVADDEYFNIETSPEACHFYGALCFAKGAKGNYCQFYIVNNHVPTDINEIAANLRTQLDDADISSRLLPADKKFYEDYYAQLMAIPDAVKEKYAQVGGDYELDGDYTVFGQTVAGFEIIDAISSVETVTGNNSDDHDGVPSKPLDDIIIESIEVVRIASSDESGTARTSKVTAQTTPAPDESGSDSAQTAVSTELTGDNAVTAADETTGNPEETVSG